VERVIAERKLRCGPTRYEPRGGGINVSRVLRRLACDAPAIYPAGGPVGELLARARRGRRFGSRSMSQVHQTGEKQA
jgi:6-phosphofructokinase 2